MLNTQKRVIYKAFGLNLICEFPLPELPQKNDHKDLIDVEITIGDLTNSCAVLDKTKDGIFVEKNLVMFKIPSVAIFSIQGGDKIIVSPLSGYSEDEARLYILGTCMGAILFQRKVLPLHGSAVMIDGKAYGFLGDSGAGKSTLASAFVNNGYQLLTDDVIAISLSQNAIPVVTPSYPQQKLWQESLNKLGMENHNFRPLVDRETKYAVPVHDRFTADSYPLAGVFEIMKTNKDEIEIYDVQGLERLNILYYNTYRNFMISPSGLMDWHFHTSTLILNKVKFYQLYRPISRFTANELPNLILKTILELE